MRAQRRHQGRRRPTAQRPNGLTAWLAVRNFASVGAVKSLLRRPDIGAEAGERDDGAGILLAFSSAKASAAGKAAGQ